MLPRTIKILFVLLSFSPVCFASVNLSVNPIDGGNSLHFERTYVGGQGNFKQIRVRVDNTSNGQYQVFQRVLEPLSNEQGNVLNLQAIGAQTLPNSNSTGTLYLQNSDHLGMGDQLLYSSSMNGQGDSFTIGYSLNPSLINSAGTFRGRLVFTVRSAQGSDEYTMDMLLEIPAAAFKVSVKGGHEPNRIHVRGTDTTLRTADFVALSFSGNNGQAVKIYQQVDTFPQNQSDEELDQRVLQVDIEGNSEGLRSAGLTGLNQSRKLIYSSSKPEDNFQIYFLSDPALLQQQAAGNYIGKITYIVETDQSSQEFPMNFEFDVPPVFTMNVTMPPGGVKFAHVLAGNPPQDEEVLVTVQSNMNTPYIVSQELESNMINNQGKEFDSKYFTLQVQLPQGQKGRTDYVEFSPMQTGEYPVYTSDARGSGATFTMVYRLQGYSQMSPGDFLAPIRLSLNQK